MSMQTSIRGAQVGEAQRRADGAVQFEFRFPSDDPTFVGHFPGKPMVPGVYQLEMTRYAAELALGRALTIREIGKAKFLRPILPEQLIGLTLRCAEESDGIEARAELSTNGARASENVLKLANVPGPRS